MSTQFGNSVGCTCLLHDVCVQFLWASASFDGLRFSWFRLIIWKYLLEQVCVVSVRREQEARPRVFGDEGREGGGRWGGEVGRWEGEGGEGMGRGGEVERGEVGRGEEGGVGRRERGGNRQSARPRMPSQGRHAILVNIILSFPQYQGNIVWPSFRERKRKFLM